MLNQKQDFRRSFDDHLSYVASIVANDGPDLDQYDEHLAWYIGLNAQIQAGTITETERDQLREAFGGAYSTATLQGFVYERPLGYAGDFQIIEKIYHEEVSQDPKWKKYDEFFQRQNSPQAVRNRKQYFKDLVRSLCESADEPVEVLNLACGPCREIKEMFDEYPSMPVKFLCLDIDERAIEYSRKLLGPHTKNVTFEKANILRFKPQKSYSLIWSAGLFDYFDDRVFARILQRYIPALAKNGQVAIGNFGDANPTRGYMEAIAKWYLHHRSDERLVELAEEAGAVKSKHRVAVLSEPTGTNRFLHIHRTSDIRIDGAHCETQPSHLKDLAERVSEE